MTGSDMVFRPGPGRRILRWDVPVDDAWHVVPLSGAVVHVAARRPDVVELWAVDSGAEWREPRRFRVFGTGWPIPDDVQFRVVGAAAAAGGSLVWHLIEQWPAAQADDLAALPPGGGTGA